MNDDQPHGGECCLTPNHFGRWADPEQPPVIYYPHGSQDNRFYCVALVGKMGTGKAAGTRVRERSPKIFGATEEVALKLREQFIHDYLQPRRRKPAAKRQGAEAPQLDVGLGDDDELGSCSPRLSIKRAAVPKPQALREPALRSGSRPGSTAGPGRGHTLEFKMSSQPEVLPTVPSKSANWFQQLQLKEQWRTSRISQLEGKLAEAVSESERHKATHIRLRARVRTRCSFCAL